MKYFITGTQIYGPVTEDSDIDVVVDVNGAHEISNCLDKIGILIHVSEEQQHYGDLGGFYFNIAFLRFNIIIKSDEDFEAWKLRTELLKKLPPIEDKNERVLMFESIEYPYRRKRGERYED